MRILALAAVMMAVTLTAFGQASADEQRNKTIEEVKKAARELAGAVSRRDEAALNRLLADDYIFTHSTGDVNDKAQRISNIKENKLPTVESASRDDVRFRVYGDTVIITSRTNQKSELNGVPREIQFRGIVVWVRQQGRWQLAAQQSTRVQPERKTIALDPKTLNVYVGQYEVAPGRLYTVTLEGGTLIARGSQREFTLMPESETQFFIEGLDGHWTFYKDEKGQVTDVGVRIGTGQEMRWKKIK